MNLLTYNPELPKLEWEYFEEENVENTMQPAVSLAHDHGLVFIIEEIKKPHLLKNLAKYGKGPWNLFITPEKPSGKWKFTQLNFYYHSEQTTKIEAQEILKTLYKL